MADEPALTRVVKFGRNLADWYGRKVSMPSRYTLDASALMERLKKKRKPPIDDMTPSMKLRFDQYQRLRREQPELFMKVPGQDGEKEKD